MVLEQPGGQVDPSQEPSSKLPQIGLTKSEEESQYFYHYEYGLQLPEGQKREDLCPGLQALQPGAAFQKPVTGGHHLGVKAGL